MDMYKAIVLKILEKYDEEKYSSINERDFQKIVDSVLKEQIGFKFKPKVEEEGEDE